MACVLAELAHNLNPLLPNVRGHFIGELVAMSFCADEAIFCVVFLLRFDAILLSMG